MLFGSICYLNLLPFHVFMQRALRHNGAKMSFRYKRGVPAAINDAFRKRRIDAAFISSVASRRCRCSDVGIVAHAKVYSVLLIPGEAQSDPASASSNRLATVLDLHGRVLIGDEALRHYLDGGEGIDLAEAWYRKTGLPFVFARLCYNRYDRHVERLARTFADTPVKLPYYIVKREAAKRGISPKELRWYLEHIHYTIDWKGKRGLKKFLRA